MDDEPSNQTLNFLKVVGIQGYTLVTLDGEKLIAISSQQFEQHRAWIERWFTLVGQLGDDCFFRKRLRGTGDTIG